jgi:hypothetical protein
MFSDVGLEWPKFWPERGMAGLPGWGVNRRL